MIKEKTEQKGKAKKTERWKQKGRKLMGKKKKKQNKTRNKETEKA